MLTKETYLGKISVTDAYIKSLVYRTVTSCFGVAGMKSSSFCEYITGELLGRKQSGMGVHIVTRGDMLAVNLHIAVTYGTNIRAVVSSVKNKVKFALEEYAGLSVHTVNVYVDSIKD
ncbi:MAG: Asp23/Gls24 family envelope stress response protein [Oscillospiraceae bacterium]|nr:Asp23/Gls24 family envelope stress response protein [Oscillospiraceae bacterium]